MTTLDTTTSEKSNEPEEHDWFTKIFRLAMVWKIFYGVMKITLGFALLKWAVIDPSDIFYQIMGHEIIEDPNDIIVRIVAPLLSHMAVGSTTFAAVYLIFWGTVDDIFLSINVLRDRLWAFPTVLTLFGVFIVYEVYRVFHTHSLILPLFIIGDSIIFWIVATEYKKVKNRKQRASAT